MVVYYPACSLELIPGCLKVAFQFITPYGYPPPPPPPSVVNHILPDKTESTIMVYGRKM